MPDFLELLLQDTGGKACLCRPLTPGQGSWIGPLPSALLCSTSVGSHVQTSPPGFLRVWGASDSHARGTPSLY